jgi:conjugal transfer/entry exclusion protein
MGWPEIIVFQPMIIKLSHYNENTKGTTKSVNTILNKIGQLYSQLNLFILRSYPYIKKIHL